MSMELRSQIDGDWANVRSLIIRQISLILTASTMAAVVAKSDKIINKVERLKGIPIAGVFCRGARIPRSVEAAKGAQYTTLPMDLQAEMVLIQKEMCMISAHAQDIRQWAYLLLHTAQDEQTLVNKLPDCILPQLQSKLLVNYPDKYSSTKLTSQEQLATERILPLLGMYAISHLLL